MKAEEIAAIKERAEKYKMDMSAVLSYEYRITKVDVPILVAEVERLRKAIDNAISLLPDGENRLANRHLCEALGVDEDHYGFFSGGRRANDEN